MTRVTRLLALTLILPVATACADMGDEEMGEPADTTAAPGMEEPTMETIELQGVNDSGITGEIESESRADSVFLDVTMEGATGSDYPAHVHSGSCDEIEAPVAAQVDLQWGMTGGADIEGESEATQERPSGGMDEPATATDEQQTQVRVGVARADLTADPQADYSLRFHGSGGDVIACADLPRDLTTGSGMGATETR